MNKYLRLKQIPNGKQEALKQVETEYLLAKRTAFVCDFVEAFQRYNKLFVEEQIIGIGNDILEESAEVDYELYNKRYNEIIKVGTKKYKQSLKDAGQGYLLKIGK